MKIYKQQIFAICAVLYALALANGNEEFLSDEQRELFSTTITSDPRSCKLTCIDQGQQFCASPQYAQGYCCDKNYNCNQGAECSTQLPAATINSNLKYFPCPYASKCGGSKLITVTNSTSTLQYNRAAGSMTTGDVCGFRLTASNTSAANTIIITFKTLSGAQAFLYSGGSTYETATKQQLVDLNSNGGRYEFQGDTDVFIIFVANSGLTAYYDLQYRLSVPIVTTPPTPSPTPSPPIPEVIVTTTEELDKGQRAGIIIGSIVGGLVLLMISLYGCFMLLNRKRKPIVNIDNEQNGYDVSNTPGFTSKLKQNENVHQDTPEGDQSLLRKIFCCQCFKKKQEDSPNKQGYQHHRFATDMNATNMDNAYTGGLDITTRRGYQDASMLNYTQNNSNLNSQRDLQNYTHVNMLTPHDDDSHMSPINDQVTPTPHVDPLHVQAPNPFLGQNVITEVENPQSLNRYSSSRTDIALTGRDFETQGMLLQTQDPPTIDGRPKINLRSNNPIEDQGSNSKLIDSKIHPETKVNQKERFKDRKVNDQKQNKKKVQEKGERKNVQVVDFHHTLGNQQLQMSHDSIKDFQDNIDSHSIQQEIIPTAIDKNSHLVSLNSSQIMNQQSAVELDRTLNQQKLQPNIIYQESQPNQEPMPPLFVNSSNITIDSQFKQNDKSNNSNSQEQEHPYLIEQQKHEKQQKQPQPRSTQELKMFQAKDVNTKKPANQYNQQRTLPSQLQQRAKSTDQNNRTTMNFYNSKTQKNMHPMVSVDNSMNDQGKLFNQEYGMQGQNNRPFSSMQQFSNEKERAMRGYSQDKAYRQTLTEIYKPITMTINQNVKIYDKFVQEHQWLRHVSKIQLYNKNDNKFDQNQSQNHQSNLSQNPSQSQFNSQSQLNDQQ
eukprot:403372793